MTADLFADEFAAAEAALVTERADKDRIQAHARQARRETRRARSEAALAEVWPPELVPGTSYHFISQGDVDALSYLAAILRTHRLDYLQFSTWCMALDDVAQIERWLVDGHIGRVDAYCGEIFPSQYADEHALLCDVIRMHGGRVCVFRNHSKLMVGYGYGSGELAFAIESSANINTNPRAEQTAIHVDRDLADFYREFLDGVKSYNRDFDDWTPWRPQA
jgi:hypothetical protein